MAKNQGQISFGIDFNVNTAGLNIVKKTLQDLQKMSKKDIEAAGGSILPMSDMSMKSWTNNLSAMRKELGYLEKALEAAYNPKLNTYELSKFNQSLQDSGTSAQRAFQAVSAYGKQGESALLNMTTNMLAVDRAAKQTYSTFQKLGDTMMNTIRWSITSTAVNTVTGAIQKAYSYSLDLDKSLTDIMIVTDKSASDMENFARQANKAAKALGSTTLDYTNASLIYYQQGLSDKEVEARTETTLKTASITGQSAETVSEQLTAVWNGYKVNAEEAELYVDKLSAVAATTAADLEELSTGMSMVASAANIMGVDADQLNAQLATIVSVTREAPETIGTALKTVYARMSDIEAGLDTETTLGEYTTQMAQMGINVLDANGKLRDMGAVVEEIGSKWTSLNREQQVSLAQSIAGTRQYSRMMALFDNWDMYQDALTTSMDAAGTLSKQHIEYLNSIEAHQNKLKASAEGLYDSIFDSDEIKGVYDMLSGVVTLVDELVQSLGGMPGILATVGMIIAKTRKQSIANMITLKQENILNNERNKLQLQHGRNLMQALKEQNLGDKESTEYLNRVIELEDKIYEKAQNLTDEQWQELQQGVKSYSEAAQEALELQQKYRSMQADVEARKKVKSGQLFEFKTWTKTGKESKQVRPYTLGDEQSRKKALKYADTLKVEAATEKSKELAQAKLKEAEAIEKAIAASRLSAEELEELRQKTDECGKAADKAAKSADNLGKAVEDVVDKDKLANTLTQVIDSLSTIAFAATGVSSAVSNMYKDFASGEATIESTIGGFGGIAMSLAPIITQAPSVITGLKAIKAGTLTGAAAWQTYWASATMGISLVITALTTVISLISAAKEEQIEANKVAIEDAKEKQEEAKANKELASSYLELYEAYKKTGEETDALKTAAEEIIETLELEGISIFSLKGKYDDLAASIKTARLEQSQAKLEAAQDEKEAAESLLKGKVSSVTPSATGENKQSNTYHIGIGYEGLSKKDEGKNLEILKQVLENSGIPGATLRQQKTSDAGYIYVIDFQDSLENRAKIYPVLEEAYSKMTNKSESEIAKNLQKTLADENFKIGSESYLSSVRTIAQETSYQSIASAEPTEATSLNEFKAQRDAQIQAIKVALPNISDATAAKYVDASYSSLGGASAQLLAREQWLESYEDELGTETISDLRKKMNLGDFSQAAFSALNLIDIEAFEGDADKLVRLAKEKAIQLQEELWAAESDARLENLDYELQRLEYLQDDSLYTKRAAAIAEENKILEQQIEILKEVGTVEKESYKTAQDEFLKTAKKYNYNTTGLTAGGNLWDFEAMKEKISSLYEADLIDEDASEALLEKIIAAQNASNKYQETTTEWQEKQHTLYENQLEAFEAINELYSDRVDLLEKENALLDKQVEMVELMYGEEAYDQMATFYAAQTDNLIAAQNILADQYQIATKRYKEVMTKGSGATDEEKQQALENLTGVSEAYTQAILDVAEAKQKEYINNLKIEFDKFTKELSGGLSVDTLKEEWDWIQSASEGYLDTIEAFYGVKDVEIQFQKAINSSTNIKNQAELNKLMEEELKILNSKDKLSEYDLKRAQARLDVLQTQIALEEARDSKTSMRLTRMADGSYSYQYVSDLDKITEAEENLLKANESLYSLDKDEYEAQLEEFYDVYVEFQEKMLEYAEGGFSDYEIQQLEKYKIRLQEIADQSGDTYANLMQSGRIATDLMGANLNDVITKSEGALSTGLSSMVQRIATEGMKPVFDTLLKTINEKGSEYYTALSNQEKLLSDTISGENGTVTLFGKMNRELDTAATKFKTAYDNANGFAGALAKINEQYAKFINEGYGNVDMTGDGDDSSSYHEKIQKYITQNKVASPDDTRALDQLLSGATVEGRAIFNYWNSIEDKVGAFNWYSESANNGNNNQSKRDERTELEKIQDLITEYEFSSPSDRGFGEAVKFNGLQSAWSNILNSGEATKLEWAKPETRTYTVKDQALIWSNASGQGITPQFNNKYAGGNKEYELSDSDFITTIRNGETISLARLATVGGNSIYVETKDLVEAFDTGGYTGDWNSPNGRLAMLHEKELVLNKVDTANILRAVDIVRSLETSMLDQIAQMSTRYAPSTQALSATSTETIEQTVHISAEFPNVSVKAEIEEAFADLVNLATQYVHSK